MNKSLTFLSLLLTVCFAFFSVSHVNAGDCVPAGPLPQPVSGTADANMGSSFSFTGVPTGNVVVLISSGPDDIFTFDMCSNAPDGWTDGTADTNINIIDINGAGATALTGANDLDDGCTNGAGPNFWGPSYGVWSPGAAGTYYLYLTEWNVATGWDNPCIADGANSYDINIAIVSPGPCDAGMIVSGDASVCPAQSYTLTTDGMEIADGGFALNWDNTNTGGTGSTGAAFSWAVFDNGDFPYSFDSDLNGALSASSLPPFAGTWEFSITALDATGAACDVSNVVSVTFLPDTDAACSDCSMVMPGMITSDAYICTEDAFTITTDGSGSALGGFILGIDNTTSGGTGGTEGPITISGYDESDFPFMSDSDLGGVLSFNSLPPLAGAWDMKFYALNGNGEICDSTSVTTVEFSNNCAPACLSPAPTNINHSLGYPANCTISWDAVPDAWRYDVHYRVLGSATWTRKGSPLGTPSRTLHYLAPNTWYEYFVRTSCDGTWDFTQRSERIYFNTGNIPAIREAADMQTEILGLYPNPASDVMRVDYIANGDVSISVTDMMGRTIYQNEMNNLEGYQNETIDVSTFGKGYYILTLQSGEERIIQKFATVK